MVCSCWLLLAAPYDADAWPWASCLAELRANRVLLRPPTKETVSGSDMLQHDSVTPGASVL
jgi:hypothetical protein